MKNFQKYKNSNSNILNNNRFLFYFYLKFENNPKNLNYFLKNKIV